MVEVKTEALKIATQDLINVLLPLAEDVKVVVEGTHLSSMAWGIIGSRTVAGNYAPAQEYQVKQAGGLCDCLNGINAGLLSVVANYREAELVSAKASNDTAKIMDLEAKLKQDRADLAEAQKKDQGLTD
ncbi:hypothetical protein [Streptosporangium sp. 'caverna']|uniref:hypothetical protein n=1 Tax=Streptosporangium sp. 'caverna' TaxID=2202249 RepID=UPI000D7DDCE1|nr:hypothetical protein [Streptosporangium sp. 'caverna']AWS46351.1 hypothetical protein DKM19_38690 [Streptosporangium sp. 'caverna']